ncbi:Uncharacterised protein [Raoultella terrigena]|uniref:Uncharacterized protein n=1 Tax=Raoultella terrigena TaxID=577 RepID=A0A3P8M0J5_RAOTE|nr:Uncharacterised protein [Raoultella terrigena]
MGHRLAFEFVEAIERNRHLALRAGAKVARQGRLHLLPVGKAGLVEAVEIELKALRLHQVHAGIAQLDVAHRNLRQTFCIQPGELVQRPDIAAVEGQAVGVQAQRIAVQAARHALQQGRVVGISVIG